MGNSLLENLEIQRKEDIKRYQELDEDLCMLCDAYGADKRSLFVSCFYQIKEIVPEAIDLFNVPSDDLRNFGYYLRICKNCRGEFLDTLGQWRNKMVARKSLAKDRDGELLTAEAVVSEANIPMRINGRTIMITSEQYDILLGNKENE